MEVWVERKKIVVINYYNPCKQLELNELERVEGHDSDNVIWCGDFNAHNTLWGGERTYNNGRTIEDLGSVWKRDDRKRSLPSYV